MLKLFRRNHLIRRHFNFKSTLSVFICLLLSACTSSSRSVTHYYDYQLYSPQGEPIALSELPKRLVDADVILVGEWHTHSAIHRFQTDLFQQLLDQNPSVTLSMEQFARDKQSIVNDYLKGDIGEQTLINQANAWPNYSSDYRALIELAKQQQQDVIAANAPKSIVRCIGRKGLEYLDKISPQQRLNVAKNVDIGPSDYKEKFMASMHHGSPEQTDRQFSAQVAWDETMAESITDYLKIHPNKQVLHIAGKFHVEDGLGIKTSILRRNPNLKVAVITPKTEISSSLDYQLQVLAPPIRYVKAENRMQAYKALGHRNADLSCE
ncbi:hypothetical protein DZ860_06045 [Vibrio sinensis]|uniref:Haem-binding uptake Tiki superfamily ChaN domain-containing protein n=1 Tax=Vibrio sinensis TaxID=2302434 RepID=A0A3A6QMS0_9VIBR|nr:ChaN family lipoprotein [Vibrio sinensis]RJX73783.1 hypothetical protein DZ860_06045 [Vibrio sinensis]